jgi:hypothetical protein
VQKVPYCNPKNGICDQNKGNLLGDIQRQKVKGGLRGSPLLNSYIGTEITSYAH